MLTARAVARREAALNVRRNRGSAVAVILVTAIGVAAAAIAAEWYLVVGRAAAATADTQANLNVSSSLNIRLPVVLVGALLAELVAYVGTHLATRPRRRAEIDLLDRVLGAPRRYTLGPALLEGATEGLVAGAVAAAVAAVAAPLVASWERSVLPGPSSITVEQGGRSGTSTLHLPLGLIHLGPGPVLAIAATALVAATALGTANAYLTTLRATGQPEDTWEP